MAFQRHWAVRSSFEEPRQPGGCSIESAVPVVARVIVYVTRRHRHYVVCFMLRLGRWFGEFTPLDRNSWLEYFVFCWGMLGVVGQYITSTNNAACTDEY